MMTLSTISTLSRDTPSLSLPMYLVSPQLLVTSEHIISASASSSFPPVFVRCGGSGDVVPLLGLGRLGCVGGVSFGFSVV